MADPKDKFILSDGTIDDLDPLLTVADTAAYLRLTEDTVRAMARTGKLPALKVGRSWRFRKSQLMQLVQEKLPHNPTEGSRL